VQHSLNTLNVGCGPDEWGDVRVDVNLKTQTGAISRLNVRADAHHLPFRSRAFSFGRCWHVLEHVENPVEALLELRRTCESFDVRFPVDEGYYKLMIIGMLSFDVGMFLGAYRTMKGRFHLWRISPSFVENSLRDGKSKSPLTNAMISDRFIQCPHSSGLLSGRKSRLFRPVLHTLGPHLKRAAMKYYYEWKVEV